MIGHGRKSRQVVEKIGGASRDRTDDLIVANDALSQLSYSPTCGELRRDSVILSVFFRRAKRSASERRRARVFDREKGARPAPLGGCMTQKLYEQGV
jgi:hypothetical protein